MAEKVSQIQRISLIQHEIRNIVLKIKEYKRSKIMNLSTPIFQDLLNKIIGSKINNIDEALINILKIEEKDDSMQIATLNFFIKIIKSVYLRLINIF